MSYLNLKISATKSWDWDDIDVGNRSLDHSQNFFGQKHLEHERLDAMQEMEMVNELLASAALDDTISEDNKENIASVAIVDGAAPAAQRNSTQIKVEISSPEEKSEPADAISDATAPAADPPLQDEQEQANLNETAKPSKPFSNLAVQWSTQKRVAPAAATGAIAKSSAAGGAAGRSVPQPPHAYEFKDLYQRRKDEAIRRRLEEERKMREFRSRPVPNFKAVERRLVHAVTVPVTPQVLKKSRETLERRKKKLEELNNKQQPKFESRPAAVLSEEPFVPKKTVTVLQPRPFVLHSERRLQERKQFDSAVQRSLEEKQRQEEEERRKRAEEEVKELRKLATFKARPNPFK